MDEYLSHTLHSWANSCYTSTVRTALSSMLLTPLPPPESLARPEHASSLINGHLIMNWILSVPRVAACAKAASARSSGYTP